MPLWSLGYEMWFYYLAASLAVWLKAGTRGRIGATLALAVGFAVFTMMKATFLFAWILGAATFWMCSRPRQPWLAAAGGVLVAIGYISNQLRSATTSVNTLGWMHYAPSNDIAILLLSLGIAVLLPFFTQLEPKSMLGVRMNHLGAKLAAFSYTLYLTHYPVLYVWEHFLPERHAAIDVTSLIWYLLRIFSCVAFAWLCYLPFEKQTGRLRKKLQKIWTQPSKVAA